MSPSPAISFEVSIITTRLPRSSANTRAISRKAVVFPTPGRPNIRIDCPVSIKSRIMAIVPNTARPTRQVRPMMSPARLRMALMRCRVFSMPARLSPLKWPTLAMLYCRSSRETGVWDKYSVESGKRASGNRPTSMTISIRMSRCG